jgi:hypothetical protein
MVALALVVLALSACASELETGGTAPSGKKIAISVPERGGLNPAQWPDACTFLSNAEIKAVLPDASDIKRESDWVTASWSADGDNAAMGRAPNGKCTYTLDVPHNGTFSSAFILIFVEIEEVASAKELAASYAQSKAATLAPELDAKAHGADACYDNASSKQDDIPSVVCRRGPLKFKVAIATSDVDFETADEGDANLPKVVRDQVIRPIVQTITAKVG